MGKKMGKYYDLLVEATKKMIELSKEPDLKKELLTKAPPVLWFGDNLTAKNKIVTIGANPSREEFLSENKNISQERINNGSSVKYIKEPLNRFKVLANDQDWTNILEDPTLQEEIITSYNNYFRKDKGGNPYKWFGRRSTDNEFSYNAEGFINALDASYFEGSRKYQGLHIDLMPFPTISDFTSILKESETYIFKDGWAKEFLDKLISEINPKTIVVFGRTNLNYLVKFLGISEKGEEETFSSLTENGHQSSAKYWLFKYKDFDVIGLSVNLGNPKGFSKQTLNEFGQEVKRKLAAFHND